MTEKIEIKEFLKTGNFGEFRGIHFGMSRDELITTLGDSEWQHFASKKSKIASIYGYGDLEFYFEEGEDGRLNGIQIIPSTQKVELKNLDINYDFIKVNLKYDVALNYLNSKSIKYQKLQSEFDSDDVLRIETEGGVQLIFLEDFNNSISIQKVSKFVSLASNHEREKQISFSISESDYQKLKALAGKEKKSVSKICKEMITDKLKEN